MGRDNSQLIHWKRINGTGLKFPSHRLCNLMHGRALP